MLSEVPYYWQIVRSLRLITRTQHAKPIQFDTECLVIQYFAGIPTYIAISITVSRNSLNSPISIVIINQVILCILLRA